MARLLLIEDDAVMSMVLTSALEAMGHEVETAPSGELGLELASADPPRAVLLDLGLPGMGGLEVLPRLLELTPRPAVAVITATPTAENAVDALALGASAHVTKPVDPVELQRVVDRLLGEGPRAAASPKGPPVPRLVGSSARMLELARRMGALTRTETTVLILGESGSGKERVARAIHFKGPRREGPFVAVSCAALPEHLLEAELFGHARGAFTGAHQDRAGRVASAEGGTLFLDEVAELTPGAQAKLLRFLEERSYERVGEDKARRASVRVLAATNADLAARVAEGGFREDLFYRLNVARLDLPPLRERIEDVPALAQHFLEQLGRPEVQLSPDAQTQLLTRAWPGNVRELRNAVESALVELGAGQLLEPSHFAAPLKQGGEPASLGAALEALVRAAPDESDLYAQVKAETEATLVRAALARCGGNQVAATRLLGMNRATFRRKMTEHGLL